MQKCRTGEALCVAKNRPKQVHVKPPPSALNTTLPALAFVAEHWCRAPCSCRSKSPARMQGAQQQTRRLPWLQSIDGRQTGGRADDRYIDPAPHMRTVSIIYRVGQKSKMCQYVNKTEAIEGMRTNNNSYRENEVLSDIV